MAEQFAERFPGIPIQSNNPVYAQACSLLNLLELGFSIDVVDISPEMRQAMELIASTRQRLESQYREEERRVQEAIKNKQ